MSHKSIISYHFLNQLTFTSLPHWRVNVCTEIFTYHKIFIIKNYIERIDCVLLLFTGSLLMSSAVCLCQECVAHTQGRGPHGAFRHTPWTLKSTLLFMEKCRSMNRDFEVHSSAPHKQKLQMEMQQLKLDKGWYIEVLLLTWYYI